MRRFSLMPAEEGFYDWFEKGAINLVEAARLLTQLLRNYTEVERQVARISEQEHHGDFIVHEVYDLLHRTFIPPFERDVIQRLASSLDDAVDSIEAAADVMLLYRIEQPTLEAIRLGDIILASAEQVNQAVPLLRNKKTMPLIRARMIEVNRLENEADGVTRAAVAKLVEHPDQLFDLIRWKEIYSLLEDATDRCEDIADTLNGIVIESV
ncbi:MAG: DUF47 domain-containing protein [Chloroflexi bacterium]|nr:DUF47 domain-containing protein [Chloroflexota bacterium]